MTSDGGYDIRIPKVLHPIDNDHLKLLVLENISQEAVAAFTSQGFHVDHYTKAMSEDELVEKIPNYHAIGIRSKTKITERVIKAASKVCCPMIFRISTSTYATFIYGSFWSLDVSA